MNVVKSVTTAELVGYKIVSASYDSLVEGGRTPIRYVVGSTYELGDDDVVVCHRGLHFCPRALDCLRYYDLSGGRRLLRVVVPVGVTVVTDDGGAKYAASVLRVDEDVTAQSDTLLTGVMRHRGITADRFACFQSGYVEKHWCRNGEYYQGCLGRYCVVWSDPQDDGVCAVPTPSAPVVHPYPSEAQQIRRILDRVEPFEK
jgi:hypothetical protein